MKTEFHICTVQPPLDKWVQFVWISKGENDATKSRILPNGAIELIINFGDVQRTLKNGTFETDKNFYDYWVAGIQTQPLFIQSLTDTNLVGIRFLPGGAYPFFKVPVSNFSNAVVETSWLKEELDEIRASIVDLSSVERVGKVISDYLISKFDGSCSTNESVMYVVNNIIFSDSEKPISELVKKAGYSHRHFISLFRQQVGTSPKNLQRILRLQKVIQFVKNQPNIKWADIFIEFPFYDAAHFAHDFKELTGLSPGTYLALRTFDENHCIIR